MAAYLDSSVLLRHILLDDSGIEHVFAVFALFVPVKIMDFKG